MLAIRLGVGGGASRWLLSGSVIAYALSCFILNALVAEVLIFGLVDVVVVWHFEPCNNFNWVDRHAEQI